PVELEVKPEIHKTKSLEGAIYQMRGKEREVYNSILRELAEAKVIRRSTSKISSPAFVVRKKPDPVTGETKYRLVVDMRKVNTFLRPISYGWPTVAGLKERLGNKMPVIYSCVDLNSMFFQIPVKAGLSQELQTFRTGHFGKWCFQRLGQ